MTNATNATNKESTAFKAANVVGYKPSAETERLVEQVNAEIAEAEAKLPWASTHPVGKVRWIHMDQVQANDYNPNSVSHHEMNLLYTSIKEDGYTMPIVCIWDEELDKAIIVDGFHRYTTMRKYQDIYDSTGGYLPIALIEKSIADRIASTVRHNRARGKHSVQGMSNLVFQMLQEGKTDAEICNNLGLEVTELARLKHVTGYSKLYADREYSKSFLTDTQIKEKAKYKKEHPDEHIPYF